MDADMVCREAPARWRHRITQSRRSFDTRPRPQPLVPPEHASTPPPPHPTSGVDIPTFFIWNLIVARTVSTLLWRLSPALTRVGNLPALVRPGPSRRGIWEKQNKNCLRISCLNRVAYSHTFACLLGTFPVALSATLPGDRNLHLPFQRSLGDLPRCYSPPVNEVFRDNGKASAPVSVTRGEFEAASGSRTLQVFLVVRDSLSCVQIIFSREVIG